MPSGTPAWRLADLDASAEIGQSRQGSDDVVKYSEAYVPPEWQQLLLPTRTEASGGKPVADQPSIVATAEQDVWQFGVLAFELCAGQEFFFKDLNDDIITTSSDRSALANWCEPNPEKLDLVFKPALHIGSVTMEERLAAQDLIALCLRGNSKTHGGGHPCPTDRPSMATILKHPFFDETIPPLPKIPPHAGLTDVAISYQSAQVMDMKRLVRCLNALGISTKDGTMVPVGADWRNYYFKVLEEATIFTPLPSLSLLHSAACYSECNHALELKKPVVAAMCDTNSWGNMQEDAEKAVVTCAEAFDCDPTNATQNALEMAEVRLANVVERSPMYAQLFGLPHSFRLPTNHQDGRFFGENYWSNLVAFLDRVVPELHKHKDEDTLKAVLSCVTDEDCAFALQVQQGLQSLGLRTKVCKSMNDWTIHCTQEASILLPVLSTEFYKSVHMKQLVKKAQELRMRVVPIRRCLPAWEVQQHDPFLCSCLNRANRIPANEDWIGTADDESHADHVEELAAAIRMHARIDRSGYALMLGRIPKYRSQMHSLDKVPAEQGNFDVDEHIQQLIKLMLPDQSLGRSDSGHGPTVARPRLVLQAKRQAKIEAANALWSQPKALLCFAPKDRHIACELAAKLVKSGQVEPLLCQDEGMEWFDECHKLQADHDRVVFLLSGHFIESYACEGQFTYAADTGVHTVGIYTDRPRFDDLMSTPVKMETDELLKELEGEDVTIINQVEAIESALHHKNPELAKACLKDLGDIIKLSFTNKVNIKKLPHYLREMLPSGIPKLTEGCQWHFFISKHEELGKEIAQLVAIALENLGFKVWISQTQKDVDKAGMMYGVTHSMCVLIIMTTGIFKKERHWCTHVEIKPAIDAGTPILALRPSNCPFSFDKKSDGQGGVLDCPAECVLGVAKDFQPYARALMRISVGGWANQQFDQEAKIKDIVHKFLDRDNVAKKMAEALQEEKANQRPLKRLFGKTIEKLRCRFIMMLVHNPLYAMIIFAFLLKLATGRRTFVKEWKRLRQRVLRF